MSKELTLDDIRAAIDTTKSRHDYYIVLPFRYVIVDRPVYSPEERVKKLFATGNGDQVYQKVSQDMLEVQFLFGYSVMIDESYEAPQLVKKSDYDTVGLEIDNE